MTYTEALRRLNAAHIAGDEQIKCRMLNLLRAIDESIVSAYSQVAAGKKMYDGFSNSRCPAQAEK